MVPRLVLDSGAVIQAALGNRTARRFIEAARRSGAEIVIPPIVLTQTLRGGTRDAAIYQVLRFGFVPFVGARLGRQAGELLGSCRLDDAADALIMAEAIRGRDSIVLTSDPGDMRALSRGHSTIRVVGL